jgi:DNA-directed RNA polymerase specialized sigma24 family protein
VYAADNSVSLSNGQQELFIPIDVLKGNSSLQAIVVYLKDYQKIAFSSIARMLNRNDRTIWATYHQALRADSVKIPPVSIHHELLFIPINIFYTRKTSVLESIVLYLKNEEGLSFNEISNLLGKNYRTIWTVYRRGLQKITKNHG